MRFAHSDPTTHSDFGKYVKKMMENTIKLVLRYQNLVAPKYSLFESQGEVDPSVRSQLYWVVTHDILIVLV